MIRLAYLLGALLLLSGCNTDPPKDNKLFTCIDCHSLQHDEHHQQNCKSCHNGQDNVQDKAAAHLNLVADPAHPLTMTESCGPCHKDIVASVKDTLHFTLKNSTNLFRAAFGAEAELEDFREVAPAPAPESALELADDLLRRRCFRCHVYSRGDKYPATQHGTGCAACHLKVEDGALTSHVFSSPSDSQCLSCHYGNYVGFDYYGRFEHDFNNEYRTPYTTTAEHFRPYGVEYHELRPDIHQASGMQCIDCHSGDELMRAGARKIRCKDCHLREEVAKNRLESISTIHKDLIFTDKGGGIHVLPLLQHPAHFSQKTPIACQACHAQWSFNDSGKHFLRTDTDDLDAWYNLFVQGSFELETLIENNTDYDKDELPVQMSDKLSGEQYPGIWIKGLTMRRWEGVKLSLDNKGVITPVRPMLDYYLSWIDAEETVHFDSIPPGTKTDLWLPYVPHTTGSAGAFWQERLDQAARKKETSNDAPY